MNPGTHDVIIIGAGTSGSALASFLTDKGLDVMLLERGVGIETANHAIALQPNGIAALAGMNYLDAILEFGQKIEETIVFDEFHRPIISANFNELDHPYPYLLFALPSDLTNFFRKKFVTKARSESLIEGFEFEEFQREGNKVKGVRGTVKGNQKLEVEAKLVIGADGPLSKAREKSGLRYRLKKYDDNYIVCVLPGTLGDNRARSMIGKGVSMGVASIREKLTYFFGLMERKEFDYHKKRLDSLRAKLTNLEPALGPILEANLRDWSQIGFLAPIGVFLESWSSIPGLTLIGDAAHAMNPSLAQGMNQSLLDVQSFGEILSQECAKNGNLDSFYKAAQEYERSRYKTAMFYSRQSEIASKLLAPRNGFYAWLAKRGMRKATKDKRRRILGMKINAGLLDSFTTMDLLTLLF
jgi:monooxygenase